MTDETAKIIADYGDTETFWFGCFGEGYFEDLQRMAKFWLMRKEIASHLEPRDPTRIAIEALED